MNFILVPDWVDEAPPEFVNLSTQSYRFKEQRLNLSDNAKRRFRLGWDRATTAIRDAIVYHLNHHRGEFASFTWQDIPSAVLVPNLIPPDSQTFIAGAVSGKSWAAYDSSVVTVTQALAGPNNELAATRIQCTAGGSTSVLKYLFEDTSALSLAGETYRVKMWAKKYAAGSPSFTLLLPPGADTQVISSATWAEVSLDGTGAGQARQVQLRAASVGGTIDAVLFQPYFILDELLVKWISYKQQWDPPRWKIEAIFEAVV